MDLYRLLAMRYLLQRWDRATMVMASIALGVATLVSARILNQCLEAAAQDTVTPAGAADLYVTNGEAGVQRVIVADLRAAKIPGVKSIEPLVVERIAVPGLDNRGAVLLGAELPTSDSSGENPLKVTFTELPLPTESPIQLLTRVPIAIARPLYDEWKTRTTGTGPFIVRYSTRDVECLPVAVIDFDKGSPLEPMARNLIAATLDDSLRIVRPGGSPQKVGRIDIYLEPGTDRDAISLDVARVVGPRAEVRTPDAQRKSTQEIITGVQLGFLVCSAGAMIVGLFLVYNAMSVTVAERRPDIGTLRSLGAARAQVVALFVTLAAILGLVGAILGVPLGIALAEFTLHQFRTELESIFLNPDVRPTRLSWSNAAWAVCAGVSTAVLAAVVPAMQAATDDPAHAVRRSASGTQTVWKWLHWITCAALIGTGTVLILLRYQLPPRVGSIGGVMIVLIGCLLSAPILAGALVTVLGPVARRMCPFPARLAFDNLARAPGRTGVVIGALAASIALMFQTAGVARSNEEPVIEWIEQVVQADHFLFQGSMTTATSSNSPMDGSVARDLRDQARFPEVDRVMTIRYFRPEFNGTIVYMLAMDAREYAEATRSRVPTGMPDLEKFLELDDAHPDHVGVNKVLVSNNFIARHGVKIGDTITIQGAAGPVQLLIVGAVRDYSWSRGTIFMDRGRYRKLFNDDLIDLIHIFLRPGATQNTLARYAHDKGLFVTDRDSLRAFLSDIIERLYLLAYVQQLVVAVVAALGVITAVLISVLQRKRELGLLLAVGATPGQVLWSVVAEAFWMGVFGTLLGILFGLPMQWYVLKVVLVDESGFNLDLLLPWKPALGIAVASVVVATLAGLIPAWCAIQTRIPDALQYE